MISRVLILHSRTLGSSFSNASKSVGLCDECVVNRYTQQLSVRGLCLIAQPLVIALSVRFRILHNGQSVFDADGVT